MGIETIKAEAQASIESIDRELETTKEEIRSKKTELNDLIRSLEKKIDGLVLSRKRFETIINLADPSKNIAKSLGQIGKSKKKVAEDIEPAKEELKEEPTVEVPQKKNRGRPKKTFVL